MLHELTEYNTSIDNVVDKYDLEFMLTIRYRKIRNVIYGSSSSFSMAYEVTKKEAFIAEWHRHLMYIATDKRVDILGHPWWFDKLEFASWYSDFDVISVTMHD